MNYSTLVEHINQKQSFLCVGLDSDITKIPAFLKQYDNPLYEFNKRIVDATHKLAVAYKPNIAFYESLGIAGWRSLEKTVEYIRTNYPDLFLIADAKRGDIGNTSKMYAKTYFDTFDFDAVTVAPYMGEDSVTPFLSYSDKWVILLALTSNKGADDFQYLRCENSSLSLFEQVIISSQKWADKNQLMYVVGATKAEKLAQIREIAAEHFLLVPGVGAQGGSLSGVAQYGMNKNCGLLVNSSRQIIYAANDESFAENATSQAKIVQNMMKQILIEADNEK